MSTCGPPGRICLCFFIFNFFTIQEFCYLTSVFFRFGWLCLSSTSPGAALEKRQTKVRKEYCARTKDLGANLHGTLPFQWGPIEAELSEYKHNGRVSALVIGIYGELPLTSAYLGSRRLRALPEGHLVLQYLHL